MFFNNKNNSNNARETDKQTATETGETDFLKCFLKKINVHNKLHF